MSNGAQAAGGPIYCVLRELGRRSQRSYAAMRDGSVVVVQRFAAEEIGASVSRRVGDDEGTPVTHEELALLAREARALAKNGHPNIARVRHVDAGPGVLFIATELIDGVTLEDLLDHARARGAYPEEPLLSHAVIARIVIDVLHGLSALHALADPTHTHAPLATFHGELCPANVVVGQDGVARIVNPLRPCPLRIRATSEALGYAAPEVLGADAPQDARVDLWSTGVMLWEALMERRLYDDPVPARVAQQQREEEVPRPSARLADVAMHALAFDPAMRFRSAQEMTAAIRAFAGTVATASTVAQTVRELAGERIRERRADLGSTPPEGRSITPQDVNSSSSARVLPPTRPTRAAAPRAVDAPPDGPRPLPARRPGGSLHAAKAVTPKPILPISIRPGGMSSNDARSSPSSFPPPGDARSSPSSFPLPDDDDDLPGPRQSIPDDEHLAELAREASATIASVPAPAATSAVTSAASLLPTAPIGGGLADRELLSIAREIAVSPRSMTAPSSPSDTQAGPATPRPTFASVLLPNGDLPLREKRLLILVVAAGALALLILAGAILLGR